MLVAHPRFLVLKTRFLESLDGRASMISGLILRGHQESFDRQPTIDELGRQLHTLNGTAGTFGFDDISFAAAEAEAVVTEGLDLSDCEYLDTVIDEMMLAIAVSRGTIADPVAKAF